MLILECRRPASQFVSAHTSSSQAQAMISFSEKGQRKAVMTEVSRQLRILGI